jgi:hypothetical protein
MNFPAIAPRIFFGHHEERAILPPRQSLDAFERGGDRAKKTPIVAAE